MTETVIYNVGGLLVVAFLIHCLHDYAKTELLVTGKRLFQRAPEQNQDRRIVGIGDR